MRGKHAALAATRREHASYESEIETYQRKVRNQESEISALKADVERWKLAHANDTRALRAEVAAGTSSEVRVLTDELRKAKERAALGERERKKDARLNSVRLERLVEWLKSDKGITGTEALEFVVKLTTGESIITSDIANFGSRDGSAAARIEQARGNRRHVSSGGEL